MMMRNVRGVESKKTREASARTSSYNQPIAMKEEEHEEKEEAKEWGRNLLGAY